MLLLMTLGLYGLGAALMRARLSLLDDVRLSDLPGPSAAGPVVPVALVARWPLVVVGVGCLGLHMTREPRSPRRAAPDACPARRSGAVGPAPAIAVVSAVMPRLEGQPDSVGATGGSLVLFSQSQDSHTVIHFGEIVFRVDQ